MVTAAAWKTTSDIQTAVPGCRVLNAERARFEVAGGNYRLIVAFKFSSQIAFVKFLGTHAEYDCVDALTVSQFLDIVMDIRPLRNDADHREALMEIERLWGFPDGSPEGDKFEVLAILVSDYEDKRWPSDPVSPRDILEHAVTDMGRSQKELAVLLGSRSQASDILKGRRRVSLEMAQKISAAWHIPIQLLVAPYETSAAA